MCLRLFYVIFHNNYNASGKIHETIAIMYRFKNKKLYFTLLLIFFCCYLVRRQGLPAPAFISDHITNFAITGMLFLIASDTIIFGKPFSKRRLALELLPFGILNVILELFIRADTIKIGMVSFVNFNTPDPFDLAFGMIAVVVLYLVILKYSVPEAVKSPGTKTR
jgi:hypothetical protein